MRLAEQTKVGVLPALLFATLLSACDHTERTTIYVNDVRAEVELAADLESRATGLIGREKLAKDQGLLMVFPHEKIVKIWMLNMSMPLDVGFFDSEGRLLNTHTMPPDSGLTTYASAGPAIYALEMNRGWFEKHRLIKNARLYLPNPIQAH
ncbi:DUF192 domain-containing protein [Candidatus Endoriftia persephone]|jgi:uncharacterized membrane protein (UPF0127 family)|uniref:Exported protein n=2 Tax=Gammaproteobacteria TaxID=1236 RepID=G2DA31_9GAMM|nr:DUF192 domain-containing protein [Candidatus Endoriftia persephone]EGV52526.1 exported protein [endosymbiont of Riftia pachyptila (vent Ph05)]USF86621.1 DUF192 domain-containing protein [Candidatus Endoriftia persephone]